MNKDAPLGTAPFYRATTPYPEEIREYVIREFTRLRNKLPRRVQVVLGPSEVGIIIHLEGVTEEDWRLAEEIEHRLVEAGEPASAVVWEDKPKAKVRLAE